ncbi:putative fatty acyl-CoA reductase-like isoform X2 [Leptotrombidium deliense]|uniref:Fatty acyl-CoA reductase n=1 Tax=Leptotrombidium deliense TaxID=299467 RepID=A0A443SQQ5_9ACAR|nr:putative fatty acyl-CoA reductase-like isoform X2 [Leptotrombidium deliense]
MFKIHSFFNFFSADDSWRRSFAANLPPVVCDSMSVNNVSRIASFYNDRSIFITGASGFMGKVLVEKLLRSCPGVKNIYILLRDKKGLNSRQRLDELFNAKIFDRIKEENAKAINKVIAISGDISSPGLGICENDVNTLVKEVSIVFHSAATVKFDEALKTSVEFNVLGTRRVIELCHKIKNLVALIHVSSAYANCNRMEVDEVLYSTPVSPQQVIDSIQWMSEELINDITPKLVGDRPNTYTYTKALAESLLAEECGSLPVAIVRPSIVTAAWREPVRGWVDNINGPTGLILACGKGILRTMLFDANANADLIPVDTVINLMITVAWHTATRRQNTINIYNCTSGLVNPITWGEIERVAFPMLLRYPSNDVFRYPGGSFKLSRFLNDISKIYEHFVPAYLIDFICALAGRKQMMVKVYGKLHRAVEALEFFTIREWRFKSDNVISLFEQLEEKDKELFHFDVRDLHWPTYWEDYVIGIRKFVLKEENSTLPQARRSLQRLYYINKFVGLLVILGIWQLVLVRTQVSRRMWFFFTSFAMKLYSLVFKV